MLNYVFNIGVWFLNEYVFFGLVYGLLTALNTITNTKL